MSPRPTSNMNPYQVMSQNLMTRAIVLTSSFRPCPDSSRTIPPWSELGAQDGRGYRDGDEDQAWIA